MTRMTDSYCRYCSIDPTDIRELKIEELIVTCSNCKRQLFFIPLSPESPYYFLEEVNR
jgi:hypothetical protein